MNKLMTLKLFICACVLGSFTVKAQVDSPSWKWFNAVADQIDKTPDRTGGSDHEKRMANWIEKHWRAMGYKVKRMPFSYSQRLTRFDSENLSIDLVGQSDKVIVVGAHYDAVGIKSGSEGLIDNGSGIAALLTLAEMLKPHVKNKTLPISVRLVTFGAEERGLQGARAYINRGDIQRDKIVGMINLDTIVGGDKLYVHSAHESPYQCNDVEKSNYSSDTQLRDRLKAISDKLYPDDPHLLHPATKGYPKGQTGSWSDHALFACAGIPIAYLEATNFDIKGKRGHDGYSQSVEEAYWTCFDKTTKSTCASKKEKGWGEIWHTKFDTKKALFPVMKAKLQHQQEKNISTIYHLLMD
jgi:hypothetical protein